MQHRKRQITLKQRMGLCLAAFFAAFAMQLTLNGYQSRAVQAVQDAQMGCFNAISRFQGGVESSISVLENYRWENSEPEEIIDRLQSASSTCNAWLWRIGTSLNSLESVSDEQRVLYSAVDTVYQTYTGLLDELENDLLSGNDAAASQLYYAKVVPCGDYLSQYTLQLLETAIQDSQTTYTTISALNERITMLQTVVVALCVALGCVTGLMVMRLLTPVQQMIAASRAIGKSEFDTPDIPLPKQPEIARLAESFNIMKHSMAQQVTTLQEKNEIERELHRQKTEALELQNRMERSRLQQLRSQIDPHFLFNTLNVIQQTAGTETAYRTQALIMALSHLLRYSLMSNDEQVPLSREVRIVDEYYSIYHVRFGERVRMEWRISDSLDLTETMVPSFILQPVVENAFKHGICPKEEGGVVRIRVNPLREKGLLCIRVVDNGVGIQLDQLRQLRGALSQPGERWEHIGIYNVAARLRLLEIGSSMVMIWSARSAFALSTIAASVVDLPEPVGPHTSTRPRGNSARSAIRGSIPSSCAVLISVGMVRNAAHTPIRSRYTFTRKRSRSPMAKEISSSRSSLKRSISNSLVMTFTASYTRSIPWRGAACHPRAALAGR